MLLANCPDVDISVSPMVSSNHSMKFLSYFLLTLLNPVPFPISEYHFLPASLYILLLLQLVFWEGLIFRAISFSDQLDKFFVLVQNPPPLILTLDI